MSPEPYDRQRDDYLDFPDDPQAEPSSDEVKERAIYGEPVFECIVDESAGFRG